MMHPHFGSDPGVKVHFHIYIDYLANMPLNYEMLIMSIIKKADRKREVKLATIKLT